MAIDDDPLAIQLRSAKQELDRGIEPAVAAAAVAGVLSMIPGIGSAVQNLLDGRARERVERRWVQLFEDLRAEIERVRDRIPDERYYGSEEFQTLLALAWEQLLTSHDRAKLRMLAAALAHSGCAEFEADDRELMVRTLRNLSPGDIQTLDHEYLKNWLPLTKRVDYGPNVLGSLARLTSSGLVIEKFLKPNPNVPDPQKLQAVLKSPPWRAFQLSTFGERFLKFVAAAGQEAEQ